MGIWNDRRVCLAAVESFYLPMFYKKDSRSRSFLKVMKIMTKYWFYLACAIVLEVAGTTSMKLSEGFTKLTPSVLLFVFYAASFIVLTFALKGLDVGIAYAIWSGIGTILIAIIGILYFREPATSFKFISIGLIIIGVTGLSLSSTMHWIHVT